MPQRILTSLCLALMAVAAVAESPVAHRIVELRLKGQLVEAETAALVALRDANARDAVYLNLELATIYDRMALHDGTRPSSRSLERLELAKRYQPADLQLGADLTYGWARYFYRAEMVDREFANAERYTRNALTSYEILDDLYGQAEATHLLGLIEMQRRKLDTAGELFDRSLELDQQAGERVFFRGEYERHKGFVLYLQGEIEASLPYFRRSVDARRKAGADDPLMFAMISLASVLEELDDHREARLISNEALATARAMRSQTAEARALLILERMD